MRLTFVFYFVLPCLPFRSFKRPQLYFRRSHHRLFPLCPFFQILGAPVWDAKKKKYLGFFDMRDILTLVLASHKKHKKEGKTPTETDVMASWFDDQQNLSIGHISYYAARNPFVSCRGDTPLEEVGRILTERHCHRVPIANDEGRCVGIISQSALVKFLVAHCDNAPDNSSLDGETLGEANLLYRKDIVAAMDTTSALEAFEMLDNHRLSGIAVVDEEDGRLVGNTSARDIKLLVQGKLTETASLEMDILSYLAAARQAVPTKKERYPSAHVAENSTVGHAIRLLSKTGKIFC